MQINLAPSARHVVEQATWIPGIAATNEKDDDDATGRSKKTERGKMFWLCSDDLVAQRLRHRLVVEEGLTPLTLISSLGV